MLSDAVLKAIDKLTDIIYSPDQDDLEKAFLELVNEFLVFTEKMAAQGYTVDMTDEMTAIERAYTKKDYVELADVLLYDIRPIFLEISVS